MNRIKLILPTPEYKTQIMDYKREFIENEEGMHGTSGLRSAKSYEEWYKSVFVNLKEETVEKGLVPAATYIAISTDDDRLVGMINVRYRLNDSLLNFGGHIGYSVRKSERNKGYATEMLSLALKEYIEFGVDRILITCDKDNIASAKTIINNGGVLENEVQEGDEVVQRYWIELTFS